MNRKHHAPWVTWVARFARGRRPDRNPLRRASDLIETAVLAILVTAFLAGAPFVMRASGTWAHDAARHAQITQEQSHYQVPAVVLKVTPSAQSPAAQLGVTPVIARWTAPDGKGVTGEAVAPVGTAAGTTVRLWVTSDGVLSEQPLLDSQVTEQADLAGVFSVIILAGLLGGLGLLARRMLDKRRMAAWDADWRVTGPRWTTRA